MKKKPLGGRLRAGGRNVVDGVFVRDLILGTRIIVGTLEKHLAFGGEAMRKRQPDCR